MTATQLAEFKALRANLKAARDAYHVALSTKAPAKVRHAAEKACTAAMDAMTNWQATL